MSTDLHKRMLAFDYGDAERDALMRQVWAGTPWMLDVRTGGINSDGWYLVMHWLNDHFGRAAFPFGDDPIPGAWQTGGATINGWTWIGFSTEEQMHAFMAAFPDRIGPPTVETTGAPK